MPETSEFPDDIASLWFLVRRVAGLMDRASEAMFRRELAISFPQFLVLSVVDAHPGDLNQTWIADRLGLTKGTVSRQIERCVGAGLMVVEVSRKSRRENTVALTEEGTRLVRRGDDLVRDAQHVLPDLDENDVAATLRVLSQLNDRLAPDR